MGKLYIQYFYKRLDIYTVNQLIFCGYFISRLALSSPFRGDYILRFSNLLDVVIDEIIQVLQIHDDLYSRYLSPRESRENKFVYSNPGTFDNY